MNEIIQIIPIIGSEFTKIVIPEINNAQNSIKIIVFDWRVYPFETGGVSYQFNQAIINRAKRGVDVQIITNTRETIKILKELGIKTKVMESKRILHAKIMIIDDKTLIIGSHNYTQNAFTLNFEASIMITNFPEIKRYIDYFKNIR